MSAMRSRSSGRKTTQGSVHSPQALRLRKMSLLSGRSAENEAPGLKGALTWIDSPGMNTTASTVIGLLCALLASCAATHKLQVTARAVEIEANPAPQVIASPEISGEMLATIKAHAVEIVGERQVFLDISVNNGRQLQAPKMIVLEGKQATAFIGETSADGHWNGIQVDVLVEGNKATVTAVEREHGELRAREQITIPVEVASPANSF